jgi:hypothetical protein
MDDCKQWLPRTPFEIESVRKLYPIEPGPAQTGVRIGTGDAAERGEKKNFAQELSSAIARRVANELRGRLPGILPDASGKGQESPAKTAKGYKKLDVNYSTPQIGLGLGVSIKTINFRDGKTKRYTKNFTRVDNELRAEASDYHERQPYAVLCGILFLPIDSCTDSDNISSFGQCVQVLRHRTGRSGPQDSPNRLEKLYIALYDTNHMSLSATLYVSMLRIRRLKRVCQLRPR